MKQSYCIAYKDKNGEGFSMTEPWLLDDFDDLESCLLKAKKMIADGYKDVIPFWVGERSRDEYSWKYVNQRKIELDIK